MGAVTPWAAKIRELLADGQWRRRDEIVALAGPFIPPGRAVRERERMAALDNTRPGRGEDRVHRPERSVELKLAVGRRRMIVQVLGGKAYERKNDERGVVWVRLVR